MQVNIPFVPWDPIMGNSPKTSQVLDLRHLKDVSENYNHMTMVTINHLPGPSSLGAKWFRYRVSIYHPLGFNWHPLEGDGICIFCN